MLNGPERGGAIGRGCLGSLPWVALACLLSTPLSIRAEEGLPKLAVLPLVAAQVAPEATRVLDELLVNELDRHRLYEVVSAADINAMLGFERMKDVAGCDDVACAVEIGGALGVRYLLAATIGRLGDQVVVSLKIMDTATQSVTHRGEVTVPADESV